LGREKADMGHEKDPRTHKPRINQRELPMDQRTMRSPRLMPLPPEHSPELQDQFEAMHKNLGFIPNSILIMQRKPRIQAAPESLSTCR